MFSEKDILARLQNGEDAQAIADEFAKMINAANKTYADQKAKEEAERKAAEEAAKKRDVQKEKELDTILDQFYEWFDDYYGLETGDKVIDAKQLIELIDSVQELANLCGGISFLVPEEKKAAKPAAKGKKPMKLADPDATIEAFLKSMGW